MKRALLDFKDAAVDLHFCSRAVVNVHFLLNCRYSTCGACEYVLEFVKRVFVGFVVGVGNCEIHHSINLCLHCNVVVLVPFCSLICQGSTCGIRSWCSELEETTSTSLCVSHW